MGENSDISWCDHTFNTWWGCAKVSPGCQHCYAERLAGRFGVKWGVKTPRKMQTDQYWRNPVSWHYKALQAGYRQRVFVASMADVFELHPDLEKPRRRLWDLIFQCSMLDWLILTKRPENVAKLVPWGDMTWPRNLWLGVSVENQHYAEARIPILLETPAQVRFVSYEPALGRIEWEPEWGDWLHWIIVGGESGPKYRPFDMAWARGARDFCLAYGIAFFFKQDADLTPQARPWLVEYDGTPWTWHQWPNDYQAPVGLEPVVGS